MIVVRACDTGIGLGIRASMNAIALGRDAERR